jgi:hypothetical protein
VSLVSGHKALADAEVKLIARWRALREVWQDAKAEEFEEMFIRGLTARTRSAGEAMTHMAELIARARSDCS